MYYRLSREKERDRWRERERQAIFAYVLTIGFLISFVYLIAVRPQHHNQIA